jgi:hypothetical protein
VSEDLLSSPTSDATAGSRVLSARNHLAITISELQAQLKRDHARRAITSQTDAEQAGRRRGRGSNRAKPNLGAARSIGASLSRNVGQHPAGKRKIRTVEYIEELDVEAQLHSLGHRKPLRKVEVTPHGIGTA